MNKKKILFCIGRPFAPFYSLLMRFRAFLSRVGIWRVMGLDVPVVSIGNLTMGGSGKTPVVQYVARFLQKNGRNPAVISRGYGGSAKERVNLVSDGTNVLLDAPVAGDEPRLLADTLPGIPVLTGTVRKYPAIRAVELGADVLVLDDGFQHMAMARDLDLVLFNADFLAGNSTVFPGGDLREPVKALNRCHGFVITGISGRNNERAERFADLLRSHFPDHPVFFARYKPTSILCRESNGTLQVMSLDVLNDLLLFGFSGIAHPERFKETLRELELNVVGFQPFADHHLYKEEELKNIFLQANQLGANGCIATEKDMVKLETLEVGSIPLYALRMEVEFDSDFNEFLMARVNSL